MKKMFTILVALIFSSLAFAEGGHLIIAMNGKSEPANLDSQLDPYDSAKVLNNFVADRLVFINPNGAKYEPHLAKNWEISSNNLTWTFTLREDVKFHDGTNFNAEAVKYNIERILNPDSGSGEAAAEFGNLESIEVVGEYQLKITHSKPFANFLQTLATQLVIWSPKALKENSVSEFSNKLIGTGPFTLEEWVPNNYAKFKKWQKTNITQFTRKLRQSTKNDDKNGKYSQLTLQS